MTAAKLLNIITLATVAILASSFGTTPANALSVESHNFVRRHADHHLIAKRQEASSTKASRKRCRPKSSTIAAPESTSPAEPTTTAAPSPPAPTPEAPKPAPEEPKPAPEAPKPAPEAPKPQEPAPPSNGGGGKGKACLAWANSGEDRFPNFVSWKTSVYYTWSPWSVGAAKNTGIDFAAMLWGEKQVGDFTRLVKPGYAQYILGFNEPNQHDQSQMSPGRGADLWAQYIEPLRHQGMTLVSPAPTNAPSGLQWLRDWFGACNGRCNPTYIGTHFYGTKASDLIAHLEEYYAAFNKPLWLTEFACQNFGGGGQCNQGQVFEFMKVAMDYMDNTHKVDRYCWFGVLDDMNNVNYDNKLIGGDNRPNDLGRTYLGL